MRDVAMFFGELVRDPEGVAALAPSSAAAADLMATGLECVTGPVVELGPGTGSFTRAILARGVAPERLTLLETSPRFCEELRARFPGVRVLNRPAEELDRIGLENVGAVVCGVPVLSRPAMQRGILGAAFRVMRRGGFLNQITYVPVPPVPAAMRRELGLDVVRVGMTVANFPPAHIFRFHRLLEC